MEPFLIDDLPGRLLDRGTFENTIFICHFTRAKKGVTNFSCTYLFFMVEKNH